MKQIVNVMSKGKSFAVSVGTGAGLMVMNTTVQAASLLPAGVFTDVQTNALDTQAAIMLVLIPLGVAIAVGKAALSWSKGGTSKALR